MEGETHENVAVHCCCYWKYPYADVVVVVGTRWWIVVVVVVAFH